MSSRKVPPFRVGFGFDVHPLVPSQDGFIALGGILISSELRADGHSDADVIIHALCDALLGAANLRDIGFHFPPGDPAFKGIDSKELLVKVREILGGKGYFIGNVDITLVSEYPKINPHVEEMQKALAQCMDIDRDAVSIKATTNEKLGFIGKGEGLVAHAVALIYKEE